MTTPCDVYFVWIEDDGGEDKLRIEDEWDAEDAAKAFLRLKDQEDGCGPTLWPDTVTVCVQPEQDGEIERYDVSGSIDIYYRADRVG